MEDVTVIGWAKAVVLHEGVVLFVAVDADLWWRHLRGRGCMMLTRAPDLVKGIHILVWLMVLLLMSFGEVEHLERHTAAAAAAVVLRLELWRLVL